VSLTYVVQAAPDCQGVDTNFKLTPAGAQSLYASGIRGVARYVSLHEPEPASDITAEELAGILGAGLGLWLVQHVLMPGWIASADLGRKLGAAARDNAAAVGYLPGAHLALDLEGCRTVGTDVTAYVEAWAGEVAPYLPLLYVGYAAGLTPAELYALPSVHFYWSDFGPRSVDVCGFAIKQHAQTAVAGIPVDPDTIGADALGRRLMWMIAGSSAETDPAPAA